MILIYRFVYAHKEFHKRFPSHSTIEQKKSTILMSLESENYVTENLMAKVLKTKSFKKKREQPKEHKIVETFFINWMHSCWNHTLIKFLI